mgnify:FL=1|jgi:hypothetical protein|tara:strand:- start:153 stop:560 length:408 start_codon:yes stop_codon:yes gene_type:complete
MADAVASQTIVDGPSYVAIKLTNISDGTGESAVTKIDVSALEADSRTGLSCTDVNIERIWWQCIGMKVRILFDADTDVMAIELGENQSGDHDYSIFGGLVNNAGTGKTGDVKFTTVGASSGDTYTVIMYLRKKFG